MPRIIRATIIPVLMVSLTLLRGGAPPLQARQSSPPEPGRPSSEKTSDNGNLTEAAAQKFRVTTDLVTVQVVVSGKNSRPVMDLKAADFQIFEDNVPQKLLYFQPADGPDHSIPMSAASPEQPGLGATQPRTATLPPDQPFGHDSELIVLLLDFSTTNISGQKLVRDGARKYVSDHMDGQDRVAVFAFDSGLRPLLDPTVDRKQVLAVLEHTSSRGDAMAGERAMLTAGAGEAVRREEALTQQIGNLLGAAGGGSPTPAIATAVATMQAQLDLARYTELQYYSLRSALDEQLSRSILLAIRAITEGLLPFPGRKTLIFLSQGFVVPPNVRGILDATLAASIRSNTAIYAIDARGLVNDKPTFQTTELESISALQRGTRTRVVNGETEFDRAAMIGSDQEESLLRYISHATGGLYLRNTNDLSRRFKEVHDDVHARYLLGYTSTNKKMDGSFRAIRVEVLRKNMKVRARQGYYAPAKSS
ncbi:MAG TPA: VWA domain-containing protein [Acidobacteriota bacterium]|jgi:VWFA-related protein